MNFNTPIQSINWEELAKHMMEEIAYDNGAVIIPSRPMFYPQEHISAIAEATKNYFTINPSQFTETIIFDICCGDVDQHKQYETLSGWIKLDKALTNYFENM